MNKDNYCSLEMSKKLVDAGIMLETDVYWIRIANSQMMLSSFIYRVDEKYPAPTMAELWRELPTIPYLRKCCGRTEAWYNDNENVFSNANPADALVELLILVKEQNKERTTQTNLNGERSMKYE